MTVAEITPAQMQERLDIACGQDRHSGKVDALVHIAWLVEDSKTPEQIEAYQTENLDPAHSSEAYIAAYSATWRAIYHMI